MDSIWVKRVLLLVIIVALIVLVFNLISKSSLLNTKQDTLITNVKLADVSSFEYKLNDKDFKFVKIVDTWEFNGYPASKRIAEITLSKLIAAQIDYIASTESSNYSIFNVTDESQQWLTITTSEETYKLLIGKNTIAGGTYVRFDNTNNVYATKDSINSILDFDETYFRDKTITSLDPTQIDSLSINSINFTKEQGVWSKGGILINSDKFNTLLATLSNIEGISIASSIDEATLNSNKLDFEIKISANNSENSFGVFQTKDASYIKKDNDTNFYIVSDTFYSQLKDLISGVI